MKSKQQSKQLKQSASVRIRVDVRILDFDVESREWSCKEEHYLERIREGQTLNAGLRRTTNSY